MANNSFGYLVTADLLGFFVLICFLITSKEIRITLLNSAIQQSLSGFRIHYSKETVLVKAKYDVVVSDSG